MQCDMCGRNTTLFKALIEETELNVCKECSKYGAPIKKAKKAIYKPKFKARNNNPQSHLSVVRNYSKLIREKREKLNLKQEDFANNINEKLSIIHKLETNHFRPSIHLARKIGKYLKINLIEQQGTQKKEETQKFNKNKSQGLTIGDLIKFKTK